MFFVWSYCNENEKGKKIDIDREKDEEKHICIFLFIGKKNIISIFNYLGRVKDDIDDGLNFVDFSIVRKKNGMKSIDISLK